MTVLLADHAKENARLEQSQWGLIIMKLMRVLVPIVALVLVNARLKQLNKLNHYKSKDKENGVLKLRFFYPSLQLQIT